ncbi:Cog8p [Sugiyamaella lignohabitans]|uniref:Conserved oligomeric Golgi complex subunit 8 n=1 Tax=Sugiyamaella lignohabitans TaxID=796027 RepID=A0A167FQD7_9ASCO|nr:Cog8p [Sugiyamaella lignohabitans]ANB15564.1 Cog8p [Sugiyamaella lignohabitans]
MLTSNMSDSDPLLDILSKSIQGSDDILSRQDLHDYIKHIRGLNQTSIGAEREHLVISSESIKTTLISLTKTSQSQFISGSRAVRDLTLAFDEFQEKLEQAEEKLPVQHDLSHLVGGGDDTSSNTNINSPGNSNSSVGANSSDDVLLLRNLEKIQDILELPSLTLTCVRNGFYSEALDLASHARRLGIRFNNIKIIQKVQEETEQIMKVMLLQLLKLLRETAKLPTLVKIISYLRRMQPIQSLPTAEANRQLHHLYISSRLHFIRNQWETLSPLKQSPDKYLKRYIEVYREHVFATVGGFRTIFPQNDLSQSGDSTSHQSTVTGGPASSSIASKSTSTTSRLLGEFLRTTVAELEAAIKSVGPLVTDKATRASLWLQLAYCSQSLGRVGGEFWPLVQGKPNPPIPNVEWIEAIKKQRSISRDIASRIGRVA